MKGRLLALNLLFLLGMPALAADIEIENAWARESPPTVVNGAAYMTLVNHGKEADRLLGASGEVSRKLELHTHIMENNVMKMRSVEAIEVAPGTPTVLAPGGLHVMLIDLKQPLQSGQTFPLRLRFEKAGELRVEVAVRKPGEGAMPAHGHTPQMPMPEGHRQ